MDPSLGTMQLAGIFCTIGIIFVSVLDLSNPNLNRFMFYSYKFLDREN